MSVEAINGVNSVQQTNITKPETKPIEQPVEEKQNGNLLLWGSLAALAIGTAAYFLTRGKSAGKNITGKTEIPSSTSLKPSTTKDMGYDENGNIEWIFEKLEDGTSSLLKKFTHPTNGTFRWSYTVSDDAGTKLRSIRFNFDKDGYYTSSRMKMSAEEGKLIKQKLEELGYVFKKRE